MNNAANDADIKNGTSYANKIGVKITMPKWGVSRGEYFYNKEKNIIAKGVTSIKYLSASVAEEMYDLSRRREYVYFTDLLSDLINETSLNRRQLDILIKIDFFSDFGNQRELLMIVDNFYNVFDTGNVKKISKSKIDGTHLEGVVKKYSVGVTKSGGVAKSYTVLDINSILHEVEDSIKAIKMEDLNDLIKIANFVDIMGYVGYVSGKEVDRPKLYITDVKPLYRKKDNAQFGYSVFSKSIGSGKESRFTVFNKVFNNEPIKAGDIILCKGYAQDGQYFTLTSYIKLF